MRTRAEVDAEIARLVRRCGSSPAVPPDLAPNLYERQALSALCAEPVAEPVFDDSPSNAELENLRGLVENLRERLRSTEEARAMLGADNTSLCRQLNEANAKLAKLADSEWAKEQRRHSEDNQLREQWVSYADRLDSTVALLRAIIGGWYWDNSHAKNLTETLMRAIELAQLEAPPRPEPEIPF